MVPFRGRHHCLTWWFPRKTSFKNRGGGLGHFPVILTFFHFPCNLWGLMREKCPHNFIGRVVRGPSLSETPLRNSRIRNPSRNRLENRGFCPKNARFVPRMLALHYSTIPEVPVTQKHDRRQLQSAIPDVILPQ